MIKIADIEAALGRIKNTVHRTSVLTNSTVDKLAGRKLFFKAENLQKTGSFKARGALNAVSKLSAEVAAVCCDSSGNHGQALSWAAKSVGKICHVAVPRGAPSVKVAAIENYGGKVHFCEPNDTGREAKRSELVEKFSAEMIHPSQNLDVIAGQGTIGLELADHFEQPLDAIIIPVGGGGLISGIATALRANWPDVKIIAAEPEAVDDCAVSKKAGKLVVTEKSDTVCDGVRTNVGKNTWPLIQKLVDDVITVDDKAVANAWKIIMERMKTVAEPTGALALAVAFSPAFNDLYPAQKYHRVGVILCGGNLDLSVVPRMLELADS